jgi:hypothetical protein
MALTLNSAGTEFYLNNEESLQGVRRPDLYFRTT